MSTKRDTSRLWEGGKQEALEGLLACLLNCQDKVVAAPPLRNLRDEY